MQNANEPIHPVYLPFSRELMLSHFASVGNKSAQDVAEAHLRSYQESAERYRSYTERVPNRMGSSVTELRGPCQIEKDEKFWIAACLLTLFYSPRREAELVQLLTTSFGQSPPLDLPTWQDCVSGRLSLFFEPNLPSPRTYKNWLSRNLWKQQLIPYLRDAARTANGTIRVDLEGATVVDAILVNEENGFAVLFEGKVLSDSSTMVTYDVARNQLARNVDAMLDGNPNLTYPLNRRNPDRTLFALLTPDLFRKKPWLRHYGLLLNRYRESPGTLGEDLVHRQDSNWATVTRRLGWLTWEDCHRVNSRCCPWLNHTY